ncbi:MAG: hypothetical protein JSW11_18685 [Candidatus Heimdallarchaeota archaeon]|nr:MAG: hypothetical protein JSW11_18685 [Candidatus Heimdallarchaeota archaeon]
MDLEGFEAFLQERKLDMEKITEAVGVIQEFSKFVSNSIDNATYNDFQDFSAYLIKNYKNTWDNYIHILRYGYFKKNNLLIIASMEVIDGGEVIQNFSQRLIDEFGEDIRNEIFGELEVPPLGIHPKRKPAITKELIKKFLQKVDRNKCAEFLASGLRNKYPDSYKSAQAKFLKAKNIDEFLEIKRQDFINTLKTHYEEETLFFTQEINEQVLEYVKGQEGMTEAGIREGNKVIMTKIPYMTIQYLNATDEQEKRYYYCHCPWVREALLEENQPVDPVFCNCSGGYYKNFWEAVLDQPVKVELLESVLKGNPTCKFALHLPQEVIDALET